MSVIFHSARELGNVAAVAVAHPDDASITLVSLRILSLANAAAFNHSYPRHPVEAWSIEEIATHYRHFAGTPDLLEAIRTILSLDYNTEANDGTDFAAEEAVRASQVHIANAILRQIETTPLWCAPAR